MELRKELVPKELLKEKPKDEDALGWGVIFTDHMIKMDHTKEKGWHDARIVQNKNLSLSPAAMAIHYGQSLFEGLKCYRRKDGKLR